MEAARRLLQGFEDTDQQEKALAALLKEKGKE